MELFIQSGSTRNTLEALAAAADGAVGGLGHFAWATRSGLHALLRLPEVQALLDAGALELVLGTDAITDGRAVQYVEDAQADIAALKTRFFVHSEARIFHPKSALFWDASGRGRLLVGSGNLTEWGLRKNWEIGAVLQLQPSQTNDVLAQMRAWEAEHESRLFEADDPRVAVRVAQNRSFERNAARLELREEPEPDPASALEQWLLVELTKGRGTYDQTSMPRSIAVNYFGFTPPGVTIELMNVDDDGNLAGVEHRWIGTKASVNFSFDLDGAEGASASATGEPPIALFARNAASEPIMYTVVSSGQPGYDAARAVLGAAEAIPNSGRLKRAYVTRDAIEAQWPDCALLRVETMTGQ